MTNAELFQIANFAREAAISDFHNDVERGGMNAAWALFGNEGYTTRAKIFCDLYLSELRACFRKEGTV